MECRLWKRLFSASDKTRSIKRMDASNIKLYLDEKAAWTTWMWILRTEERMSVVKKWKIMSHFENYIQGRLPANERERGGGKRKAETERDVSERWETKREREKRERGSGTKRGGNFRMAVVDYLLIIWCVIVLLLPTYAVWPIWSTWLKQSVYVMTQSMDVLGTRQLYRFQSIIKLLRSESVPWNTRRHTLQ